MAENGFLFVSHALCNKSGTPHVQFALDQVKFIIYTVLGTRDSVVQIFVFCWVVIFLWA